MIFDTARKVARLERALRNIANMPGGDDEWDGAAKTRCLPNMPAKGMAIAMMHRAAAQCEQLMIKLDGLDAAVKIEVSGFIDIKAMAPEQRKQRIDELLQKREAAKMLPPGEQVH